MLLVTNMRGGSSLLGEAFNQNKDTFYWFEPIDGIYSYLYGADYGWKPLDIDYATSGLLRLCIDWFTVMAKVPSMTHENLSNTIIISSTVALKFTTINFSEKKIRFLVFSCG